MSVLHRDLSSGCLLDMPDGCKLRVDELTGSPSERSRLYSMGIIPGTEIEVCRSAEGAGSVCVRIRQCSMVLGESMAKGIHCCQADDYPLVAREYGHRHQHGHYPGHGVHGSDHSSSDPAEECHCRKHFHDSEKGTNIRST